MWLTEQYRAFLAALQFLSILSLPGARQLFDEDVIGTRIIVGGAYFPLIGLLLALLPTGFALFLMPLLPPLVSAILLLILQQMLTGGLHFDGLTDSFDGLLGGKNKAQRLDIMQDSRVGSFGVLGGVCVLLLKFACFASLANHQLLLAFLLITPTARWCMLFALYLFPSARETGLGYHYHRATTREQLIVAGIISLALAVVTGRIIGIIVWMVLSLLTLVIGGWIMSLIDGLTGDNYGAIAELTETLGLLLLVCLRAWF